MAKMSDDLKDRGDRELLSDFAIEKHRAYVYDSYKGPLDSIEAEILKRMGKVANENS